VRSGVEPAGRNAHCLRHSVCSLMTALNASHFLVMEAVGHVSVAVTRQYSLGAKEYLDQLGDWPRNDEWPEFWLRRPIKVRAVRQRG
jgi:integrase